MHLNPAVTWEIISPWQPRKPGFYRSSRSYVAGDKTLVMAGHVSPTISGGKLQFIYWWNNGERFVAYFRCNAVHKSNMATNTFPTIPPINKLKRSGRSIKPCLARLGAPLGTNLQQRDFKITTMHVFTLSRFQPMNDKWISSVTYQFLTSRPDSNA